jgi:hypothetical protein
MESEVYALLPRNADDVDLDQMDAVPAGPEVDVVDDLELVGAKERMAVVQISGDESSLTFYTNCSLPYLVLHFWNSNRFVSINIALVDDKRQKRVFNLSNKRSIVTVDKNVCSLPMEVVEGWQRVNLDLGGLLSNAFGTNFVSCLELQVCGTCKLARAFFQNKDFADNELPEFLRVCRPDLL